MQMIRWMCNISLKDRLRSYELRGRLNLESIGTCVSGLVDEEQLRCQVQLVEEGQRKHGKK